MLLLKRAIVFLLPVLLAATLSACTSSVVVGNVYDRFGSQNIKRFKSYATFDQSQQAQIDYLITSYHSWHRTTQLQSYASLLRKIVSDLEGAEAVSFQLADSWWAMVRGSTDEMRRCNPFNATADLLASLNDAQVKQIAARLRDDHNTYEDEYNAETNEQRIEHRVEQTSKWGKRGGASFTQEQKNLLRKALTEQIELGSRRYQVRRIWMEEFIAILAERKQSDFKQNVNEHIDSLWRLTADAFPEEWSNNERLWVGFLADYFNTQSTKQRKTFIDKALKTADTLDVVAMKTVPDAPVCHSAVAG